MRLIIVAQMLKDEPCLAFKEFYDEQSPPYAILSHTWDEQQEVIYGEDCSLQQVQVKKGYHKISNTCKQAHKDKIEYVWIDTCCIDKSSSAELSEAINSMFVWYGNAEFCYVYLVDVADLQEMNHETRWFTRGWTLQELVAPKNPNNVMFFNTSWHSIGNKVEIVDVLCEITKINKDVLLNTASLSSVCIGRRLSWAASRTTKRAEDEAYCLLGILDINMPIMYGEGRRAFYRLQEEIVRSTNELTVLAWTPQEPTGDFCGFFAKSVKDFSSCSELEYATDPLLDECEISVTNKGLNITAPEYVFHGRGSKPKRQYALKLNCNEQGPGRANLALSMRKIGPSTFLRARKFGNDSFGLVGALFRAAEPRSLILLTKLPYASIPQSLSLECGQRVVSSSRFTLVQIEYPDWARQKGIKHPYKIWDVQDNSFFGSQASTENWGSILFDNGAMFVCLWSIEDDGWRFRGVLLDTTGNSLHDLQMQICVYAVEFEYRAPFIETLLQQYEMKDHGSVDLGFQTKGLPRRVAFTSERLDDPCLCSGPRWIVRFV